MMHVWSRHPDGREVAEVWTEREFERYFDLPPAVGETFEPYYAQTFEKL